MFTLRNPNLLPLLAAATTSALTLKDGSPLAKLSNSNILEVDNIDALLSRFGKDELHEAFMGEMSDKMTNVMRSQIAFIRNHVTATIESVQLDVEAGLEQSIPTPPRNQIVMAYIPQLLTSEYLKSSAIRYQETNVVDINVPQNVFPALTSPELVALATYVKDDEVLTMVNQLLDSTNVSIVDIYNKWFRKVLIPNYPKPFELVKPAYVQFGYVETTIVYLLANAFYAEPRNDVNLDLTNYNAILSSIIASTGKRICNFDKVLVPSGKLKLTTDVVGGVTKIVIRQAPYDKLLARDDVTPDTVIGFQLSGTIDKIDDELEEAQLAAYIAQANKSAERENAYMTSIIKGGRSQTAIGLVIKSVSKLANSEKRLIDEGVVKVIDRCRRVAEAYGNFNIDELHLFIRHVVCLGLYPNSGALKYLKAMDRFQAENPNLKPREAATLATIAAQVDWCIAQLK